MAIAQEGILITRRRSIAGLFLDATVEERFTSKSVVTQNPVEFGANISDHGIRQPDKYILSGRISDVPIRELSPDPWKNGDADTRSKAAWAILNELKNALIPFTIESGLQRYDNMLIETLNAQQNARSSNVLDFVAECTQVIIVDTEETLVGFPQAGETEEQASSEVDRGDVQTEEPEEAVEQSWLLQLRNVGRFENGSTDTN